MGVCVCDVSVCVCEREGGCVCPVSVCVCLGVGACVYVCVCEREKERCFARKSRKSEREKEALQGFRFLLEIIFRKKYH